MLGAMADYVVGQRWMSAAEPELGLGTVVQLAGPTVDILFPATGEMRQYAVESAPLQRVRFGPGDQIEDHQHAKLTINSVRETGGLLVYCGDERELPEAHLSDLLSVNTPQDRFLHGQVDESRVFELRLRALGQLHRIRKAPWRGFVGGRISLIPHQLYIVQEVAGRMAPRVLLADEVGLGKTIEACLILHRLLVTGRAQRVLIVVPEALLHQWFVELRRRFNLTFSLFDEERCTAIQAPNPGTNPFLDDQLILTSLAFLAQNEHRTAQATAAGWDLVVIDEAHHLSWSPEQTSPEYRVVESLSQESEGLLLLTATPQQLGQSGHFARLRLLDPDRYYDLTEFAHESEHYRKVAKLVDSLLAKGNLTPTEQRTLAASFPQEREEFEARLKAQEHQQLIDDLLDRHGPGRVIFRNTRASMTGFPKRSAHPVELLAADLTAPLREEFREDSTDQSGSAASYDYRTDPRLAWLVDLIRGLGNEKILLICKTRQKVGAIEAALRERINVKAGLFHEEMTLLQRDRSAAWFAEEEGARILLCAEIGSEGRNFQFAHHLVLFDLPLDPNLLEQRIGRLDRIGQTSTIHLHVPFVRGTPQELTFRWYHEGLNAFEQSLVGGQEVLQRFGHELRVLAGREQRPVAAVKKLITQTRAYHRQLVKQLTQGRDHLLELGSFRAPVAQTLVDQIARTDQDTGLDEFVLEMFDHFGMRVEELSPRTFLLGGGDLVTDAFPALPTEGIVATCDRAKALAREDVQFLSWDHPIVTGAMDLMLGSEKGTSCFAVWETEGPPALFLEAIFILECLAPERLHADRFLPPTPIRVAVDHRSVEQPTELWEGELRDGSVHDLANQPEITRTLLPQMLEATHALAQRRVEPLVEAAQHTMQEKLGHEAARLQALRRVNPNVRQQEIDLVLEQLASLQEHLAQARLRLDALRLIRLEPSHP